MGIEGGCYCGAVRYKVDGALGQTRQVGKLLREHGYRL
jgi:hypothetical protein